MEQLNLRTIQKRSTKDISPEIREKRNLDKFEVSIYSARSPQHIYVNAKVTMYFGPKPYAQYGAMECFYNHNGFYFTRLILPKYDPDFFIRLR